MATGDVIAIQDLGAAGLTSSTVESAAKARRGFLVDVSQVHRRERGMSPYEVMLSESQERMLLVVPPDRTDGVRSVFAKWDIPCQDIGEVIEEPDAHVVEEARTIARVPIRQLSRCPSLSASRGPIGGAERTATSGFG